MTALSLILILIAAFFHAGWNFLAKRAGGGAAFVWLFAFLSVLIYFPLVVGVFMVNRPQLGGLELLFMLGSAIFHMGYFLTLQQGYKVGDLSLVYPLARGTGPTLSTLAAIMFFGERPTVLALLGGGMVVLGVFILTSGPQILHRNKMKQSLFFGLLTGTIIAGYTLWDSYSVSVILIPPLLLDYGANLGRAIMLAPYAYHQREQVRFEWQTHRLEALGVAVLSPLAYILVLTALTFTPVSYVAPAREVSVLIVVAMGTGLLKEGDARRRLVAASLIILGIAGLALN